MWRFSFALVRLKVVLFETKQVKEQNKELLAIYKLQPLLHANELLAATANSTLRLCVVLAGSGTEVAAIVPLQFRFLK